jgi:hypothetical protein
LFFGAPALARHPAFDLSLLLLEKTKFRTKVRRYEMLGTSRGDERLVVVRGDCVVENIVHAPIQMARFPGRDSPTHFRAPLPPRPFDHPYNPVARRRVSGMTLPPALSSVKQSS